MARGYVWRAMEWGSRLSRDRDDKSTLDTVIEAYKPGIDRTLIQQNLRLTVEERVS